MSVHKLLTVAGRRIRVSPVGAAAVKRSLKTKLQQIAQWGPDEDERQAAAHALAILCAGNWSDAAFRTLGAQVKSPPAPLLVCGKPVTIASADGEAA